MARFVLISHCLLAQTIKAKGGAGPVKPLVDWAAENEINLIQMPCPEALYEGVNREPKGYKHYNNPAFREHCRKLAFGQARYMHEILKAGHKILGVIGVVFSPACSTIKDSPSPYHPYGIYMEALEKEAPEIKFVCITENWKNKLKATLESLLQ